MEMKIEIKFETQHRRRNIVHINNDIKYDCGVAGALMLLNHYNKKNPEFQLPEFEQLAIMLWADIPPGLKGYDPDWGFGVYVTDVYRTFRELSLQCDSCIDLSEKLASEKENNTFKCNKRCESCGTCTDEYENFENKLKQLLKNDCPVMVGVSDLQECENDEGHWIVLIGYNKDGFIYYDPWLKIGKKRRIDFKKFEQNCDRAYISIVNQTS